MAELQGLHNPWLIAVWPGMGNVALAAGSYLVEQLNAEPVGELPVRDYFEVQHVDVSHGLAEAGRVPRSLLFVWRDPEQRHDLIIFIGEAQPNQGGHALARMLIDHAQQWGVQRCLTFAAMATQLHPSGTPRVFGAATDKPTLKEIEPYDVELLDDGQISGMNGVLLAAAAERDMQGACLLGELPYFAVGVPNPRASAAVLQVFSQLANIELDFSRIEQQAEEMDERLANLLERLNEGSDEDEDEAGSFSVLEMSDTREPSQDKEIDTETRQRIERLFQQAQEDRAKAHELKKELDRLNVFEQYEDRFLDLFKKAD
jgi:proteasome assembly chaperone (PAC2) family protein